MLIAKLAHASKDCDAATKQTYVQYEEKVCVGEGKVNRYNDEPDVIEKQKQELLTPPPPILPYEAPNFAPAPDDDSSAERAGCARGCMWLTAGIGGCLLVALVGVGLAVVLGFTALGALFGGVSAALGGVTRANVDISRTLVTSVQPLGVLVTFRTDSMIEDIRVGVQQNIGNACGIAASHMATGGVEAGIDLSQITEEDVVYDPLRNVYTVTLPAPILTSCRIDTIQQYNRTFTLCPVDWDTVRMLADYTALIRLRDDAIEGGALQRAAVEGALQLTSLLQNVTDAGIEIVFRDPVPAAEGEPQVVPLGASCYPEPPAGWRIDPNTGGWTRN
jgi:hypothetical protein